MVALERTIASIPDDIPVILDAKIGDIGHTQAAWGAGLFRHVGGGCGDGEPVRGRRRGDAAGARAA
jgi:hypothetical protein